jgi:Ser/Thr protein kinase RdoA (MazF antagonist)
MQFPSGSTVSTIDDLYFAVFQRVRGRSLVELDDEQLRWLGRLIGRMHGVSQSKTYEHRPAFNSERMTENLELILASTHMSEAMHSRYKQIGESLLNIVGPKLDAIKKFPIHGDCHLANVLWNESGPYFVDFDDTRVGPAVQDLWMLVQGKDEHSKKQLEHLVSGYELFCEFDRASLSLIEPLRAYRIIYYSAWIVRRWHDPAFPKLFPHFGTEQYWNEEITALSELLGEVSYSY